MVTAAVKLKDAYFLWLLPDNNQFAPKQPDVDCGMAVTETGLLHRDDRSMQWGRSSDRSFRLQKQLVVQ